MSDSTRDWDRAKGLCGSRLGLTGIEAGVRERIPHKSRVPVAFKDEHQASEVARWVKAAAAKTQPEFDPWDPHSRRKEGTDS